MYNQMRDDILVQLQFLDKGTLEQVMLTIDRISIDYEVKRKCTDVAVYEEWQTPKLVKTYIISKCAERVSSNTSDGYYIILRKFFDYVRINPEQVKTEHIRLFLLQYQRDTGVQDCSLDHYRVVINGFFQWCCDNEYIIGNPAKRIKRIKSINNERKPVSRIDLEKIRYNCKNDSELALIEFLFSTGCRREETCSVKVADVDFDNGSISVVGKGKKRRTVFLNDRALFIVKQYVDNRGYDSEYLFCNERGKHEQLGCCGLAKRITKIVERSGVSQKYTPHCFRHATATTLHDNGMDIRDIQVYLGHDKMDTTGIYIQSDDRSLQNKHKQYLR